MFALAKVKARKKGEAIFVSAIKILSNYKCVAVKQQVQQFWFQTEMLLHSGWESDLQLLVLSPQ